MQQPSGFQDSIISKWRIEGQASQYVQKLHSRDLNASYLSSSARMASFLSHEVNRFLAGKITAVLQLTDTDVAFSLKAAARRSQEQLRRELRQKAIEEDIACVCRCGPYEILRIAHEAFKHCEKQNQEEQTLLKGLRRNGFLAYRPCFESKCLKPVKQEGFFEQLPQGSHRMPRSWVEQRYNFFDEQGVPLEAQWDKSCGPGVTSLEFMEDATQHGEPGCRNKLECMKEQHPDGIQEPFVEIV